MTDPRRPWPDDPDLIWFDRLSDDDPAPERVLQARWSRLSRSRGRGGDDDTPQTFDGEDWQEGDVD